MLSCGVLPTLGSSLYEVSTFIPIMFTTLAGTWKWIRSFESGIAELCRSKCLDHKWLTQELHFAGSGRNDGCGPRSLLQTIIVGSCTYIGKAMT